MEICNAFRLVALFKEALLEYELQMHPFEIYDIRLKISRDVAPDGLIYISLCYIVLPPCMSAVWYRVYATRCFTRTQSGGYPSCKASGYVWSRHSWSEQTAVLETTKFRRAFLHLRKCKTNAVDTKNNKVSLIFL